MPLFKLNFSNKNFTYGVFQIEREVSFFFDVIHAQDFLAFEFSAKPVFLFETADVPSIEFLLPVFLFEAESADVTSAELIIQLPVSAFSFQVNPPPEYLAQMRVDIRPFFNMEADLEELNPASFSLKIKQLLFFDVLNPVRANLDFEVKPIFNFLLYDPILSSFGVRTPRPRLRFECSFFSYNKIALSVIAPKFRINAVNGQSGATLLFSQPLVNFKFNANQAEDDAIAEIIKFEYYEYMFVSLKSISSVLEEDDIIRFYIGGDSS